MPSDRDLALMRAGIEAAAKAAWRHYMDKCIELGIPPAEFEKWLAATTIRALYPAVIVSTIPEDAELDDDHKKCNVCGQPVRYGERHHTCGSTVMALEKELDALRRDAERWRPEVITFADAMEAKLRKNDHKGHWRTASLEYLRKRMTEERHELSHELAKGKPNPQRVLEEAADVANFAMMIADWVKARDAK